MSNKEKGTKQKEEKVITKYDLKMQKRKEVKEKEKKQQRTEKIILAVVIVALVCFIASFPIRSYMAVNNTFIKINGENITELEFDYNYNVVKNNYLTQFGSYLTYFGLDTSSDFSSQMYSDTLTWGDYFEQQTVNSMIQGKALKAAAEKEGFTCDIDEAYKAYEESIKSAAEDAGVSTTDYIKQTYGSYATMDRIEKYIRESLWVNAYYTQKSEEFLPSEDELQAYYEANKKTFDSVDYYVKTFDAVLPTEPTELADPVEETEETTTEDTEETYKPSEAEIEKAMADAKELAEAAKATISTDGELKENVLYSQTASYIGDWLFDDTTKEGDITVIEDTSGKRYYTVSLVKRFLDETPTVDARIIMTAEDNGQAILDEWKNGEATEESFGVLADKYTDESLSSAQGGNFAAIGARDIDEEVSEWLFEPGRAEGDTTSIMTEDGYTYIIYYKGTNDPAWRYEAKANVLTEEMEKYLQEISEGVEVDDSKGNLAYLKIQEAEETAASETETEATETAAE